MFYMHRMIECLGSDVLQLLSPLLGQLLDNPITPTNLPNNNNNNTSTPTSSHTKDLLEFIRLINQIMSRFKVLSVLIYIYIPSIYWMI